MFLTKKVLILCGFFSVFPAQAGVFPDKWKCSWRALSIPRASGGVPLDSDLADDFRRYSPRKRGCSRKLFFVTLHLGVFPAQAGVFRLI